MNKLKQQIEDTVNIFKSGDLSKAERLSKDLLKSNPQMVFLYNLVGLILAQDKKIDEAIEYYEKGLKIDPNFRPALKKAGFLVRDSRVVERKKYGQPGARKKFQFSKR